MTRLVQDRILKWGGSGVGPPIRPDRPRGGRTRRLRRVGFFKFFEGSCSEASAFANDSGAFGSRQSVEFGLQATIDDITGQFKPRMVRTLDGDSP